MARVSIQTEDFDLSQEVAALRAGNGGVGAVVSFIGTVRERSEGQAVSAMELEHYPGMTEAAIERMFAGRAPTVDDLIALAQSFGVDFERLNVLPPYTVTAARAVA